MAEITNDEISEAARSAESAAAGDKSMTRASIKDMILAQDHAAKQAVVADPFSCLNVRRRKPPGGG